MNIGTDSNILLRLAEPGHSQYSTALDALANLRNAGHEMCIFPQGIYEFWAVATRPISANGLGKSVAETTAIIANIRRDFTLLPDNPAILPEWLRLVTKHSVRGKPAHDACIVAALNVHAVTHILTFNVSDFQRYPNINALDPVGVAAGILP
jgi:predicted nucleic acid-binding protein